MQPGFVTNYDEILEQINSISPAQYGKTRNFTDGAVTYLSPYISRGTITLPKVWEMVKQRGFNLSNAYKFVQELAWREYFQRCWWQMGDGIFTDIRNHQADVNHHEMISAIKNAATGIDAIDEGINIFYETGYMHNHLRMYVAGITCNIGKAHWEMPARWMYYHLLDGDLASNYLSWQWVAGTFSSKKYIANQENINRYTHSTQQASFLDKSYDELYTQSVPESLRAHETLFLSTELPVAEPLQINAQLPILLYNTYWINVDWRNQEEANRILVLDPAHFKRYPISKKVLDFILKLAKDTIPGIQIYIGDPLTIPFLEEVPAVFSIEHPLTAFYPGKKDPYPWMFPSIKGKVNSYFNFWKKAEESLK